MPFSTGPFSNSIFVASRRYLHLSLWSWSIPIALPIAVNIGPSWVPRSTMMTFMGLQVLHPHCKTRFLHGITGGNLYKKGESLWFASHASQMVWCCPISDLRYHLSWWNFTFTFPLQFPGPSHGFPWASVEKCWFFLPFSRFFSESEVRNARPSRVGVSASAVRRTRKHSAAAGVSKSIPRINWETAFSQLNSVKVWKNLKKCWAMGDTILFWGGESYFLFSRANC